MKWLRICALIVFTLGAMRAGSWALGWILAQVGTLRPRIVAIGSNLAAFAVFAWWLYRSLLPGEPIDSEALIFGFIVFAAYGVSDLYWLPWTRR